MPVPLIPIRIIWLCKLVLCDLWVNTGPVQERLLHFTFSDRNRWQPILMCAFFKIFLLTCYNLFPNNFYMSCSLASLTLFYKSTNVMQTSLGNQPHPAFLGQPWTRPAAPCQSESETSCGAGAWGSLCLCSTCDKLSVKAQKPLLGNFRKLIWPPDFLMKD